MAEHALDGIRRVLVVGSGRSGRAVVAALTAQDVEIVVVDEDASATPDLGDVPVHVGVEARDHLDGVDLVVPSPGVPEHAAVIQAAIAEAIPVWSEPELGWRLAPRPVVAITGTNGKTSVTELTAAMLSASGIDAVACGNIGTPFTTAALEAAEDTVLVAELSSFQLRFCHRLRPWVAVLLNLEPDHLDWHGDLGAYGAAKARIWRAQQEVDEVVANAEDPNVVDLVDSSVPGGRAWFSGRGRHVERGVDVHDEVMHVHLDTHSGPLFRLADLPLDAPHHRDNVSAAACAALLAGADPSGVATAAGSFRPGPHRLEHVASGGGVTFVDDSKATNVGSARAALNAFPSIVWVAGGLAKGADLAALRPELGNVRAAVVIGEAAAALAEVCEDAGVHAVNATSMEEAVEAAAELAEPGDTVLLAPACASFDMFDDYADRGDRFAAAATAAAERLERAS
ncbi:MAG: UDP-N-acetylmuramoyl-L-alanine--D-glutamate ligase [Nitriliruptorales bacterium]|nr:UDP-N-acetylmuramoyl-L-alanine--D-glutamate ligase [Nitriliruptorales bacterium]